MKKVLVLSLLIGILILSACAPQATPMSSPVDTTKVPLATVVPKIETAASPQWTAYTNATFGLSFQYPSEWFGPDEYVVEQTLRLQIGSDVVYPYGTDRTEQIYTVPNSYAITIQYSQNDQVAVWGDTYNSLLSLQDGESLSDARDKLIRIGTVSIGVFDGIEYIATLSDTAQTEPVYARQVVLFDENSNALTIMGSPNNVMLADNADWRDAYRLIDEANQDVFHAVVESMTIK